MRPNYEKTIDDLLDTGDGILPKTVVGFNVEDEEEIPEGYVIYEGNSFGSSLPIGAGCDYYGTVAPTGFLFADGSAISRTEYAELFEVVGTIYGAGDGSTTFNLPDKRSRVSAMYDSSSTYFNTLGKKDGSTTVALTTSQLPSHTHKLPVGVAKFNLPSGTSNSFASEYGYNTTSNYYSSGGYTSLSTGSGSAHSNLQPYIVCNYIIKVK